MGNRGLAYTHLGMNKDAMRDFQKAIEKKSDEPRNYFNMGDVYCSEGYLARLTLVITKQLTSATTPQSPSLLTTVLSTTLRDSPSNSSTSTKKPSSFTRGLSK